MDLLGPNLQDLPCLRRRSSYAWEEHAISSRARRNAQQRAPQLFTTLLLEQTWHLVCRRTTFGNLPERSMLKAKVSAKHAPEEAPYSSWLPSRRWLCHSTKPFSYNGNIIEARWPLKMVKSLISQLKRAIRLWRTLVLNAGACLWESALVPDPSSISQCQGLPSFNTLFDENASTTWLLVQPMQRALLVELRWGKKSWWHDLTVQDVHVDFMIGSNQWISMVREDGTNNSSAMEIGQFMRNYVWKHVCRSLIDY